jgi:ribosomal protein S18 acetylase RimI-like enzyme
MSAIADYSAREALRDGRTIEIRALRPEDREGLVSAVKRCSVQSIYRRFFGMRTEFSDKEVSFFLDIDFVDHVALVAVLEQDSKPVIIGGARFVLVEPGKAELAFAVVDEYQRLGIGAALLRHLILIGRMAGLRVFLADVMPDNSGMLRIFERSGLKYSATREPGVVHVVLEFE